MTEYEAARPIPAGPLSIKEGVDVTIRGPDEDGIRWVEADNPLLDLEVGVVDDEWEDFRDHCLRPRDPPREETDA